MKIIGAGFGRTGTMSLKLALEQLGFAPCYHMFEIVNQPERLRPWLDVVNGARPDWARMFDGYQAAVDWPASAYWRELAEEYPQAKVVLTDRDPDRWYDSIEKTLYRQYLRVREDDTPFARMVGPMVWDGIFEGQFEDREGTIDRFREHIAEVVDQVPGDRLLVYRTEQGWGPLCEFLDLPIPDAEFPRTNDSAFFRNRDDKRAELSANK